MKYQYIFLDILISLFFLSCIMGTEDNSTLPSFEPNSSCREMLDSFAFMTSNFTYCAIRHARPIRLCQECVTSYYDVKSVYTAILQIEDMGGGLCRDQLINLDRLQVVGSGFSYVDQLWSRAFCSSCFSFVNGKAKLSEPVAQLLNVSAVLETCINTYHNTTTMPDNLTCSMCSDHYLKLNDLYNNMKADTGDINFCMDIIDMMNTTRNNWSKVLGCCNDRKRPEKTFMSIFTGILVASFLFYVMVFAFTRKAEQPIVPQKRWKQAFAKRPSIVSTIATT